MKWTPAILLGLFVVGSTAIGQAQSEKSSTVHTNKQRFAIPFQFDAAELARLQTKEVRLYVSIDSGSTWQHVQSVDPNTRRFYVRAPKDGVYWFAVRTVGRDSREHPAGGRIEPELKVNVDTTTPKLKIQLSQSKPGRVQLTWTASDADLDSTTLTLESLQGGSAEWNKVFVTGKPTGTTSWNVPGGGTVEVRGRISDRAGNVTMARDTASVVASGKSVPVQPVPDLNQPIASQETNIERRKQMPAQFPGVRIEPQTNRDAREATDDGASQPTVIRKRIEPVNSPGPSVPSQSFVGQPVSSQHDHRQHTTIPTKIVKNRRFDIGYRVDKVGSSGVNSVDLYITQDSGRKWYRYGTDEDRTSPVSVVVPKDGEYGFVIRVRSGAGLGGPPPQSGDRPEVKVIVDRTPPELRLLPILQGTGEDLNRFLIRWASVDSNPAEKSISIAYAVKPDGPWITIVSAKKNTGRHLWTVADGVPPRVYLRLRSFDNAGNASQVQTARPIIVDLVRPSAQITGVSPTSSDSSRR